MTHYDKGCKLNAPPSLQSGVRVILVPLYSFPGAEMTLFWLAGGIDGKRQYSQGFSLSI